MIRINPLFKPLAVVAAMGLFGASSASAVVITDNFDYVDQTAFEAAYDITTLGATSSATLNTTDADVDLLSEAGTGNFARITNSGDVFQFDAANGATISLTAVSGNAFSFNGRLSVGLVSVTDPTDRVWLQWERGGSPAGTRVRLIREVDGVTTVFGDTNGSNLPDGDRYGTFSVTIGATDATATRAGGVTGGSLAGVTNIAHGLDFSNFAGGARLFVEMNTAGGGDRQVTIDDLVIDATLVPEPGSMALVASGALLMLVRRRQ